MPISAARSRKLKPAYPALRIWASARSISRSAVSFTALRAARKSARRRELPAANDDPERLFPCRDGLRDPPPQRRRYRKDGLPWSDQLDRRLTPLRLFAAPIAGVRGAELLGWGNILILICSGRRHRARDSAWPSSVATGTATAR